MIFWLAVSVLIFATVLALLWPLMARRPEVRPLDDAVARYEANKTELDRQLVAQEISERDHAAALAEQGRVLLQAERHAGYAENRGNGVGRRKLAAVAALVGMPLVALPLYLHLGEPGRPDQPLVSRARPAPQTLDIAAALEQIERHLAKNPDDARGFEVVAPVYMKAGRFEDAARAYRRLVALKGEAPDLLADLGESLVATGNGIVNDEARKAFERALALEAAMPKAKFYLALAREQDGDARGALADLRTLAAALPESAAKARVGVEIDRLSAEVEPGAAAAIASLPEAERLATIRGMVETLQARLYGQGGSADEWGRLVQARIVLKDRALAEEALGRARAALAGDGNALSMLDALAGQVAALPKP